jgi:2-polyprenyl-3-methyl-5-hydroxy-6-metoxy-1,4-benzoquinol methylase
MLLTETQTTTCCTCCGERDGDLIMRMGDPYLDREDTFDVVACHRCGLIRTKQLPADLPRWYEEHYSKAQRIFEQSEHKTKTGRAYRICDTLGVTRIVRKLNLNHHRFIASQVPATGKILEVGCGAGEILALVKTRGAEVYGVEPHPDSARAAMDRGVEILADRLESLDDFEETFDTVLFSFALEHTEDPMTLLKLARAKLAADGTLLIFTHNFHCLSKTLLGRNWSGWHLPYHTYFFTKDTLCRMLTKAGFRPVRARSYTRPDLLVESFRLAAAHLRGEKVAKFAQRPHLLDTLMCSMLTKPFGPLGLGNSLKIVAVPDSTLPRAGD